MAPNCSNVPCSGSLRTVVNVGAKTDPGGDYEKKGTGELGIHRRNRYTTPIFIACKILIRVYAHRRHIGGPR